MAELNEYIVFALMLSAATGVISALSHRALARETELAVGVICLLSLSLPIAASVPSILDIPRPSSTPVAEAVGGYLSVSEEAFCVGVREYVAEELSADEENVIVSLEGFNFSTMRAERITLTLSGAAAVGDVRALKQDVRSLFLGEGGECKVVIDLEG